MSVLFPLLLILIFIIVVAWTGSEGMWSNALTMFNLVTAGLVATNFWEPIAEALSKQIPKAEHYWDFSALWVLFIITFALLRLATDLISRYRVRFPKMVEWIGGYVFAVWVAWALVGFTAMTLHTAPLAREFMFGGFRAEKRMLILAPDRQWLGFMHKVSRYAFSRGPAADSPEAHVFDPYGDFPIKYASRREKFETQ